MRACSRCDVLSASASFVSPSSVPSTAITRSPMRSNPPAAAVPSEGMRSTLWDVLETLTPIDPCESSATMIRSQSSPDSVMRLFVSSTGPISRCWRVIPSAVWMRSSGLVRTLSGSASLVAARDVWVRRDVWRRRCGAVDMAPGPWWRSAQPRPRFDTSCHESLCQMWIAQRSNRCGLHWSILPKSWEQAVGTRGHHGDDLEDSAPVRCGLHRHIPAGSLMLRVWQQLVRSAHPTTMRVGDG